MKPLYPTSARLRILGKGVLATRPSDPVQHLPVFGHKQVLALHEAG